jgi:hypothetical protein
VYAPRYQLGTGFHKFELFADERLADEANRLHGWLCRRQFKNAAWRRAFRAQHPQCIAPNRMPWTPYFSDDEKPARYR